MNLLEEQTETLSRRGLLSRIGAVGLGAAATAALAGCGGTKSNNGGAQDDQEIANAAATAEALAVVMYYNLIHSSIYTSLNSNPTDQAYLNAALEQESNHYNLLVKSGAKPGALTFYFPTGMFTDAQTTFNTLITLEYAFIAAYLIGVQDFSSTSSKLLAAQIMGVEAEHRTLARDIAIDLGLTSITVFGGSANASTESLVAPNHAANNLAYERTYSLPNIGAVVTLLNPFVTPGATGFSTTPFAFNTTAGFYATDSPVLLDQLTP